MARVAAVCCLMLLLACTALYANDPTEVLVRFQTGTTQTVIDQLMQGCGATAVSCSAWTDVHTVCIPNGSTLQEMMNYWNGCGEVDYVEPNGPMQATVFTPNDPLYTDSRNFQWNMKHIGMPAAWEASGGGSPSTVIAVVDTGVAYENFSIYSKAPDLAGTTFVQGYDFINDDNHPNDDNGHGTHVTGTLAQTTHNAFGVAGIAYNCAVMPVKVLNSAGSGSFASVADGIAYASANGANIISMSLGGGFSLTIQNAVIAAHNNGVTLVAASGNSGNPNSIDYPGAFAETIAVGATRYDNAVTGYSNKGSLLDLVAPGGDTSVDQNGDGFGDGILQNDFNLNTQNYGSFGFWFLQGTSMATPHVSAVAALIYDSGVTDPEDIRCILQHTAIDMGAPGFDTTYGWGLLNAEAALELAAIWPSVGDANGDNQVDGADLAIWQNNYDPLGLNADNNTVFNGDFNCDGLIDGADLALWQAHYDPLGLMTGQALSGGPLDGEIPEPATMGLLASGAAGIAALRRSRKAR